MQRSFPIRTRPFAVVALALAAVVAFAAPNLRAQDEPTAPARPFLWRIDGETPSYLFGTIHLPDERVTTLHADVEAALESCDALYTELAMDLKLLTESTKRMMLPRGTKLVDVIGPELLERLQAFFAARRMPLTTPMDRMKPWVLATQVSMIDVLTQFASGRALDLQLYQRAQDDDKEVGGRETIDEQMNVFDGLEAADQAAVLKQAIDQVERFKQEGRDFYEELIASYRSGAGEQLEKLMDEGENEDQALADRLEKALLIDRNARMADRIADKLRDEPKKCFFFAVGAAHYFGDASIVKLLRQKGFTVTRIPETQENIDEEIGGLEREIQSLTERIEQLRQRKQTMKKAG